VNVLAVATSECQQIGRGTSGLDANHHHASLAVGAARPLDRRKQRLTERELRHMTLLGSAGAQHLKSPIKPMAPSRNDNRQIAGHIDVEQLLAETP
jgi:hypothetical protein